MTRVLIADDHAMFADGIASILEAEDDIKVVGQCLDGPSVIDFLKNNPADILLLLSLIHIDTKVLAISMFNEESFVTEILNNGAMGYILKNTGREELLKAINTILSGTSYFSKDVTETIMKGLMNQRKGGSKESRKVLPKIVIRLA